MICKKYKHFLNPETLTIGSKCIIPIEKDWKEIIKSGPIQDKEVIIKNIEEDGTIFFVDLQSTFYKMNKEELFQFQYYMYEYVQCSSLLTND